MANVAELALLFKAEGADAVDKAVDGVSSKLSGLGKIGDGLAGGLVNVGKIAAVGVAGIATAAVGVGGALLAVGGQFDDAFDGMAVKTGATGQALEGLQDSFKNVIGNTPADFETVSAAMGTLSQRTGATGKELEVLTTQVADLSRITGVDATAAATAAADVFAKWGTTGADQGKVMDQLFVASQQTGIGFEDLAASVTTNASALQAGGLGMRESIGLISNLKSAGIDASEVMPKLGKAMAKMVKEGQDPAEGLSALFDTIKSEGPNSAAAIEALGPAGLKLAAGIASGKVELGAFSEALASSSGAISDTATSTADFGERMDMMKNKLMVAFEPMGSKVMDLVTKFTDAMLPIVERVGWAISDLSDGDFIAFLEDIGFSLETAKEYGYPLIEMFDNFKESLATASEFGMGFSDTLALILENLGFEDAALVISDLSNAFAGLMSAGDGGSIFQTLKDAIMGIDWAGIKDTVGGMFTTLGEAIAGIDWAALGESFMSIAGSVGGFAKDGLTALVDGFKIVGPYIADLAGFVIDLAGKFGEFLMPILSTVFGFIADHSGIFLTIGGVIAALAGGPLVAIVGALIAVGAAVPPVIEFFGSLGDKVAELAAWIGEKWTEIKDWIFGKLAEIAGELQVRWDAYMALISAVLSAIKDYVLAKWTAIKEDILSALEGIRVFISQKWDAIKEYLTGKLEQIKAAIFLVWTEIKDAIGDKLAAILETVSAKWEEVKATTEAKLDQAKAAVMAIWQAIKDAIGEKLAAIADAVSQKWEDIKATASAKLAEMSDNIRQKFEEIRTKISDAWDNIKRTFSEAWDRIKEVINLDELIAKFQGFKDRFTTIGSDLIEGLKAGVSKGWDTLKAWMEGLFGDLITLAKKILGIASPSKVMAEEVGEPMALGIVMGMQAGLSANPIVGIVEDWTKALRPGEVAKLITPVLGSGIGAALVAAMAAQAGKAPEQVSSRGAWYADAVQGSRTGIQPGDMGKKPDDGRVRADAFHSGKGGHLAASSSNYWQVFVAKWGVPTEASARKVSRQLGIPLPQWLLDIYNPPQGETVDAPDVLKDPAPAMEAGHALTNLAKVAQEVADALKAVPVRFALEVEKAAGIIGNAMGNFIPSPGDSNPRMRPLPPGGIGGPIVIDPPGGTSTFGAGGGYGTGSVMLATQTVNLAGPVNVGFTGTFQVGGGRSLAVELVDALIADTGTFDKLIRAEDNRRAQKP